MVTYLKCVFGLFSGLHEGNIQFTNNGVDDYTHTVYCTLMNRISVAVVEMLEIQKRNNTNTHKLRENFVGPVSHALTIEAVHLHAEFLVDVNV